MVRRGYQSQERILIESEIFENDFLHERAELEFRHMEVQVDSQASEVDGQIVYLYK